MSHNRGRSYIMGVVSVSSVRKPPGSVLRDASKVGWDVVWSTSVTDIIAHILSILPSKMRTRAKRGGRRAGRNAGGVIRTRPSAIDLRTFHH